MEAISLYMKAGLPAKAARLAMSREVHKNYNEKLSFILIFSTFAILMYFLVFTCSFSF